MAHVQHNTGNQEHYTPEIYVDSARKVMGCIDIDPASNDIAQQWIGAKEYYTKDNSGLNLPWAGNVWMNPPYDSKTLSVFVDKLISENPQQSCVLCNNNTETKSSRKLLDWCDAICLVTGRIRFVQPTLELGKSPLQGQIIYYKGSNVASFLNEFSSHGVTFKKG